MPIKNPILLRDQNNKLRSLNYEPFSNFKINSTNFLLSTGSLHFSHIDIDNHNILHLVHYIPRPSNINFSTGYILFI